VKLTNAPILLVEDDPNDVLLIQRAFQKAGVDTPLRSARDGGEALAYLMGEGRYQDRGEHPFPVMVLLDLKMPGGTGFEVISAIRAQPELRRLPVVVLTSSRRIEDVNQAYDAGASSYLVKPVAFEALHKMLTTFGHYWLNFNTPPTFGSSNREPRSGLPHATRT
jgi:CheY-like chemotaxis protein